LKLTCIDNGFLHARVGPMPNRSSKKRPRDPNQLGKLIVALSLGEAREVPEVTDATTGKDPAAVALGRKGGLKGGKARAKSLSAKKRKPHPPLNFKLRHDHILGLWTIFASRIRGMVTVFPVRLGYSRVTRPQCGK
jgi:hypothetical protein